ncbi:hypothetical protein RE628_07510 [Paenibacillus sp. D2_2]|uniref:hypothetical protein n=1 Tax=Paenibacillus sp. D2_2 TaxID=3073092 RepID=UPI002814C9DA|nr:hypothetical protein [Paenibacillus sp. D2_2]WMT42242.1 hypothetical protein RE628_07510 [Paenibacillus sp. D2_2]
MALGEMHKYRDGIVREVDGSRAVKEVYIVTPAPGKENSGLYADEYHQKYQMGAYCLRPGENGQELVDKLIGLMVDRLGNENI